ncbi:hypothetical protein [Hymenobacter latericus]|uniref:hypothetical protein n=1 Tax=Hymenobacter sp. YIM 151858-1 TaxID=2987688 RepID=UPI002226A775|nr:hypothetical protein [Hymenobacter sp. YIM 151858-1]UYZ57639.1 hypothetical protein OIS50_11215 [Hymenobacter sp. YIM 151858-1]
MQAAYIGSGWLWHTVTFWLFFFGKAPAPVPTYTSFDTNATINGESVRSLLAGLRLANQGPELLARHGIAENPEPGKWYSMQAWLDVLADVEAEFGPETLYSIGLQVVDHSQFPASLHTLSQAMRGLDLTYRTNVHGQNMGYYHVVRETDHELVLHCRTPNPVPFDLGIITGLARRFKPADAVRVKVEVEPERPVPTDPHLTAFSIRW